MKCDVTFNPPSLYSQTGSSINWMGGRRGPTADLNKVVKRRENSVQQRTHAYMNSFDHRDLGNLY